MLRQTAKYALARWIPGLVNFAAVALYTRMLDSTQYGSYALVAAWVGLSNALLFQWMRTGVRRYLVVYREERPDFLHTAGRAYLVLAAAVTLAGIALALLQPTPALRPIVFAGLVMLLALAWTELNLEIVLAEVLPGRYGAAMLIRAVTSLGCGAAFAAMGYGATGVIFGITVGYVLAGAWLGFLHAPKLGQGKSQPAILRRLLDYGVPLTLTFGLDTIVISSDRLLLGALAGIASVGPYAAAYNISQQAITTLMVTVNLGGYPMAVRALELGGRQAALDHLRRHAVVLVGLAVPAAATLWVLAPNIARVVLGPDFRESAAPLIPLIALASLLAGLKVCYFDLAFQLGHSTVRQVWTSAGTALANVLFCLALIPRYGPFGAVWSSILAFALGLCLSVTVGRHAFPMPVPGRAWSAILVATTAMAGALFLLRDYRGLGALAIQCTVGAAVYSAGVLVLDIAGLRRKLLQRIGARGAH